MDMVLLLLGTVPGLLLDMLPLLEDMEHLVIATVSNNFVISDECQCLLKAVALEEDNQLQSMFISRIMGVVSRLVMQQELLLLSFPWVLWLCWYLLVF